MTRSQFIRTYLILNKDIFMNFKAKHLLDKLIEHYGGKYSRINNRMFWEAPNGKTYHVSGTFVKRMVLNYKEHKENGTFSAEPESRPEEVTEIGEEAAIEKEASETSKKKKKDRPKKTKPQMEVQKEPGEESINPLENE